MPRIVVGKYIDLTDYRLDNKTTKTLDLKHLAIHAPGSTPTRNLEPRQPTMTVKIKRDS